MSKKNKEQVQAIKIKYANRYNLSAQSWVFDRGYKIYPEIEKNDSKQKLYRIVIKLGNQVQRSKSLYKSDEYGDIMWDIYNSIYNEHNKNLEL
jgi:hypothetical protein